MTAHYKETVVIFFMKAFISQVSVLCIVWLHVYYEKDIQAVCLSRDRKNYFPFIKKCKCWINTQKFNKIEIISARRFTISPALDAVMRSFLILCHLGSAD